MPDLPGFDHSPYMTNPDVDGWALVAGNPRWIALLDPAGPFDHVAYRALYIARTERHHGIAPGPRVAPSGPPPPGQTPGVSKAWKSPSDRRRAAVGPPSIAARAGFLAGAIASTVASGGKTVSAEERDRRLAICVVCEHFNAAWKQCRKCTCYMPWKSRIAALHCPIDRW